MCRATLGATPVKRCTVAASAIFSCGVRGTPSCAKTLNRVPELPNAHDGVSMCWRRSAASTRLRVSGVITGLQLLIQIEYLVEYPHPEVGPAVGEPDEELGHLGLPPGVDRGGVHRGLGGREILGVQVPDEKPVVAQEQRIVVPTGVAQ